MSFPTETSEMRDTVRLVSQAIAGSDYRRAYEMADAAIASGLIHPAFFNTRAVWFERQKRDEEALTEYESAASLGPPNPLLLNAIGLCLTRLQRLDEAVAAFDEAIKANPAFSPSYHRKGLALGLGANYPAARRAHEQAVRLNPRDAEALANLASIAARNGEKKETMDLARRALAVDPNQATAIAAEALVANSERRFAEAERLTRRLTERSDLNAHARATALGLLADALDGQDRVAEAFEAYRRENEVLKDLHAPRFAGARSATDFTRDLTAHFRGRDRDWLQAAPRSGRPGRPHAFVLGFYRSGTTLLGQVLAAHPGVVALEERDFLLEPAAQYLSDPAGLAHLATMTDEEANAERDAYWRRIGEAGVDCEGKLLVDKQPLNTIKLPLIARLFPEAKIVLALRDPRDVVLSCFRRHFEINAAMFDLLTLDGAAAFYDATMRFAQTCRPMFGEAWIDHRYEDTVSDFDAHVATLCNHLGIEFSPKMREFYATARAEDIRSPSALQVTRELYGEGVGQWRRYREQIAPALPALSGWISQFGYPEE